MKTRRIISFLLALVLVAALLPTAALASSAHTAHSGSCEHEGWTKLRMDGTVLMAGDTACPSNEGNGGHDYFLPDGSYRLDGDITTDKMIIIEGAVDLCLNGHSIIESGSYDGIAVNLGGTLNLYDESGNSGVITHADSVMGGAIHCNGEFNMYGGTISGNKLPGNMNGIVYVDGNFTMAGGAITGNEAGGDIVDVAGSGTFTMTGGTISGNKVFRDGGGVFVDYGCVFEMTGGTIENNTAGRNGSNVYIWNNGTFRLGGGTIADITYQADGTPSGSVYIYEGGIFEKLAAPAEVSTWDELQAALSAGGDIVLTADVIPDNPYWANPLDVPSGVTAKLDLNGHIVDRGYNADMTDLYGSVFKIFGTLTVTDSAPDADHGGAVAYTDPVTGDTVEVTGGVITGGFYEQSGGGVRILGGTFNLEGGSITGNGAGKNGFGAVNGLGGGVYMQSGTFNMSGGAVVGNRAVNRNTMVTDMLGKGGGVYVNGGTFTMSGGTVSGNEAGRCGGGVYLASEYSGHSGSLVSGGATVTGNAVGGADNNVYLEDGGVLAVSSSLTGTVGVTMQTPGVFTSGLSGRGTADNFVSDDAGLVVSLTDAGEAQLKTCVTGVISVQLNLTGRDWRDSDEFTFYLNDAMGDQIETVTITKDAENHTVSFTGLQFTEAGTYSYEVNRSTSGLGGIRSRFEAAYFTFKIVEEDGELAAKEGTSLTQTVTFDYIYSASGTGEIKVRKALEGRDWQDGDEFTFTISAAEGTPMPSEATVRIDKDTAAYTAGFGEISFTREGTYSYTIRETAGSLPNVTYDAAEHIVTITVEDDGAGNLVAANGSSLTPTERFTNTYVQPTYEVTVTPGANMMMTAGAASQTVTAGDAMERVIYMASEGYYFPEDYAAASVNGVTVMWDSFTRITVFGTPTADASITLPDPTAQTREETPAATFTATGPDTGALTGVTAGMTYAIDGGEAIAITGERIDLTGLAPCTITVIQPGNGTTTVDSDEQTITVTKAEAPALTAEQLTPVGGKGSIPTTAEHEFSTDGTTWTACTGETTGLVPNTYYVRVKAADTVLASDAQEIVIIAPGSVAFSGRVTLNGRPMTAGDTFTFEVSANGIVIATAQSDATGNIDFTEINYFFSDVGQHSYTVKQSATTLPGVAIDGREYTVDVIVSYNPGDAALTVTPSDHFTGLYFTNTYDKQTPPEYSVPTGLEAIYGQTLADVALPDGWAWDDALTTKVGNVGDNTFSATYTPDDTTLYKAVTAALTVSVAKAGTSSAELPEGEKPKVIENLIEDVFEQALVTAPEKLPEGYTGIEYSTDGENWSGTVPTGKKAGEYTVQIKYIGDANHEDFEGDAITVAIVKAVYAFTNGEGELTYTKGSGKELTATVVQTGAEDTSFEHFAGVYIGETELQKDADYKVKKGSTVVTILPAALDKLGVGNQTLTVRFTNGEASAQFTVLAAGDGDPVSPQTGDNSHIGLWIILMTVSAIAATSLIVTGKRKRIFGK